MNETLIKVFMISYFLLYYGFLFVLKSFLVFKRTGKNPYVLGQSKGVISFVEKSIKTIGIIILVIASIFTLSHAVYLCFIPIQYLEGLYFDCIGIAIMVLGFIVCLTAQYYMRSSWKIGIGLNADVNLVEEGIFKYSRNPFFLGTVLSYVGFFFVLPNILSFTVGIVYYFLIQIQVRFEEEYLFKSLGNKYQKYCSDVRRWL